MEALGVVANVAAVIQLSVSVFEACRTYYLAVKDARTDILRLQSELRGLEIVLIEVTDLADNDEKWTTLGKLVELDNPMLKCQMELESLVKKLQVGEGENRMRLFGERALKWPFKSKDIDKIIVVFERVKSLIGIALAVDQRTLNLAMNKKLDKVTDHLTTAQKDSEEKKNRQTKEKVIKWLLVVDPSPNYQAALSKHEPGTGEWLLDGASFKDWKTSHGSLMWLYGIPGCGKTILSSTVIHHLTVLCEKESGFVLGYFYFDFNDIHTHSVQHCLSSILAQLCNQIEVIPGELVLLYEKCSRGTILPRVVDLIPCLSVFTKLSMVNDTFIVFDALDEYPRFGHTGERTQLLSVLKEICGIESSNVHLLVTSRHEADIKEALTPLLSTIPALSIQGTIVASDIETYVRSQLATDSQLKCWPQDVRLQVELALLAGADGMFRWVFCQLEAVKKCLKRPLLMKALRTLPATLDDTYDRILSSIDEAYQPDARRALHWLAFSERPLSVSEVAEAACIDPDAEVPFDADDRFNDPEKDILEILGSLVTITTDNEATVPEGNRWMKLSHFSVKEYLLSRRILQGPSSTSFTPENLAHTWCARSCLAYFLHFSHTPEMVPDSSQAPFLEYALLYWSDHLRRVPEDMTQSDKLLDAIFLCSAKFELWQDWVPEIYCSFRTPHLTHNFAKFHKSRLTPLLHAAAVGLPRVVKDLLAMNSDASTYFRDQFTPLHMAVKWRNLSIAQDLLQSKLCTLMIDAQEPGWAKNTPLHLASQQGDRATIELLLRHGAATNLRDSDGNSALIHAIRQDHHEVMQELIKSKGTTKISESEKTESLTFAAKEGRYSAIGVLLQLGVRPAKDTLYQLAKGPSSEEWATLHPLFEQGLDIDAQDEQGDTALAFAAASGNLSMVHVLLSHGADPHLRNIYNMTSMHHACSHRHIGIISTLLHHGVSLSLTTILGWSLLHCAIASGLEDVARFLVEQGADIEARSDIDDTPLIMAAQLGSPSTVAFLLAAGADVNARSKDGMTALHVAARSGHLTLFRDLIEHNADPRARDEAGKTPRDYVLELETASKEHDHPSMEHTEEDVKAAVYLYAAKLCESALEVLDRSLAI